MGIDVQRAYKLMTMIDQIKTIDLIEKKREKQWQETLDQGTKAKGSPRPYLTSSSTIKSYVHTSPYHLYYYPLLFLIRA